MYPLKIRCQESVRKTVHTVKNVCGTYVHGVFDREDVAEAIVRVLGEKKGIDVSQMTGIDFAAFKETQYDILAAELRKHLDMKKNLRKFWKQGNLIRKQ